MLWGAGVAKQIKEKLLPKEAFTKYYILCKQYPANILLGHVQLCHIHTNGQPKIIANLFAEDVPTGKKLDTNYEALEKCRTGCLKTNTVPLPFRGYLGCGLAGGDWDLVYDMIEKTANAHGVDVTLYYLESSVKMLGKTLEMYQWTKRQSVWKKPGMDLQQERTGEEIWKWFEETFHVSVAELMGLF